MKNNNAIDIYELDKQFPGMFSPLDREFAGFMQDISGSVSPELVMAARILSSMTSAGNVCVDISAISGKDIGDVMGTECSFSLYGKNEWLMKLKESPVIGMPGEYKPMILDGSRLYLYRYWKYEQSIALNIKERLRSIPGTDRAILKRGISRLFGKDDEEQMIAAAGAALHNFCVISGGPGTGKTASVIKILSLILEAGRYGAVPRIALTAPTGKAAARLNEALRESDIINDISGRIGYAIQSSTIHRLLGSVHGSPYFKHNSSNPVPYDVVVVDESSMVDIALMSKLLDAVPVTSRIILLGDRDQLASVEAGSVFGDICGSAHSYSEEFIREAADITSIELPGTTVKKRNNAKDSIMFLNKSYRFGADSGIGALARAVRDNDPDAAVGVLRSGSYPDVTIADNLKDNFTEFIAGRVLSGYGAYLKAGSMEKALGSFPDFSILCALRAGPFGVERINSFAEDVLHKKGLIFRNTIWYGGRPVMITRNDYELKLYNGDTGIILGGTGDEMLYYCSRLPDGTIRRILPAQLPAHETAYAMTVHKSQGSEFENVLLLLPDRANPVLTRELLYTAVTRARKKVEIIGSEKIIRSMIGNPTGRTSGLRDALWG